MSKITTNAFEGTNTPMSLTSYYTGIRTGIRTDGLIWEMFTLIRLNVIKNEKKRYDISWILPLCLTTAVCITLAKLSLMLLDARFETSILGDPK